MCEAIKPEHCQTTNPFPATTFTATSRLSPVISKRVTHSLGALNAGAGAAAATVAGVEAAAAAAARASAGAGAGAGYSRGGTSNTCVLWNLHPAKRASASPSSSFSSPSSSCNTASAPPTPNSSSPSSQTEVATTHDARLDNVVDAKYADATHAEGEDPETKRRRIEASGNASSTSSNGENGAPMASNMPPAWRLGVKTVGTFAAEQSTCSTKVDNAAKLRQRLDPPEGLLFEAGATRQPYPTSASASPLPLAAPATATAAMSMQAGCADPLLRDNQPVTTTKESNVDCAAAASASADAGTAVSAAASTQKKKKPPAPEQASVSTGANPGRAGFLNTAASTAAYTQKKKKPAGSAAKYDYDEDPEIYTDGDRQRRAACKVVGCQTRARKHGLCPKHGGKDTCSEGGCTSVTSPPTHFVVL